MPNQETKYLIEQIAPIKATVLIKVETSTGKEIVAQMLHWQYLRKSELFVAVNRAAILAYFLKSELFGHEKGTFTSAIKSRVRNFEPANVGTLS